MPRAHFRKYSLGRHVTRSKAKHTSAAKGLPRNKVQTVQLKPGTLIFHGHSGVKEWSVPHNRPAFFGGTLVALYYALDQPKYVTTYVLVKPVRLLDLSTKTNYGRFYATLNPEDKRIFSRVTGWNLTHLMIEPCQYTSKRKDHIRFCTENFIDAEDAGVGDYAMLRFAKMICSNGYDGYYIPPIFERAYEPKKDGTSELLTEQIILCQPRDIVLKVNQLSIKAMVSNMRKKSRSLSKKRR